MVIKMKESSIKESERLEETYPISLGETVSILLYNSDKNSLTFTSEKIPSYQLYSDSDKFLTTLSGCVQKNEPVRHAVHRIILENSGLILDDVTCQIVEYSPLFLNKFTDMRVTCYIVIYSSSTTKIGVTPTEDMELLEIPISELSSVFKKLDHDLDIITSYMLDKFVGVKTNLNNEMEYIKKSKEVTIQ